MRVGYHEAFSLSYNIINFSAISYESYGAIKRALLVGIDDYKNLPDQYDLHGTSNDIRIIKDVLITYYGFNANDIKILQDTQSTKQNIISTFQDWLVDGTKEGDMVFFYYSGHGTQLTDLNADESDGYDEVLLPYDIIPVGNGKAVRETVITDDELGNLLEQLGGRQVVTMVDSCNSGTITRGIGNEVFSTLEQTPAYRVKYFPLVVENDNKSTQTKSFRGSQTKDLPDGQIHLTASRDDQKAIEQKVAGVSYGVFTLGFVESVTKNPSATYGDLFQETRKIMKDKYKAAQDPQIKPESGAILNQVAFKTTDTGVEEVDEVITEPIKPEFKSSLTTRYSSIINASDENVLVRIDNLNGLKPHQYITIKNSIDSIPYVKVVQGDSFDLLIRGDFKNGKYNLRLVSPVGDVSPIKSSSNLDDVIKDIAPKLEYTYVVKKLSTLKDSKSDFQVSIDVAGLKRDFRIGEKVVYDVSCNEDCYLLLLNLDSDGNVNIIFPNKYHRENFIKGGEVVQIPSDSMIRNNFELEFFPPAGEETVKAIATNKNLDLQNVDLTKFENNVETAKSSPLSSTSDARDLTEEIIELNKASNESDLKWSSDTIILRSY